METCIKSKKLKGLHLKDTTHPYLRSAQHDSPTVHYSKLFLVHVICTYDNG